MSDAPDWLQIHPSDNVAVALRDLPAGADARSGPHAVRVAAPIPRGHKLALVRIARGQSVIKYGWPIGRCTSDIDVGQHVHVHNLESRLAGPAAVRYEPAPPPAAVPEAPRSFEGFVRADGRVGVRNDIWILPTVGCVNGLCRTLAERTGARLAGEGLDGVWAFEHPYGCSQLGEDLERTRRLLAALANHPNAGGVLVVGLGCEDNPVGQIQPLLAGGDPARVRFLTAQDVGDDIAAGQALLDELARHARTHRRRTVPVSKLVVGLKCGGSDAFSGITANPLLGAVADRIVRLGGTTLLTEVPEMFGAEPVLLSRCATRAVFDACLTMINAFRAYYERHGQPVDANPSPGNRAGGLTTLEEKSLGCIQKAGSSPVAGVLPYAEPAAQPGLNLVSGPGNDLVSVTALAAAGAQIVLFTTGRGTPLGGPVPAIKVSTTSELARRKPHWIDFDAGPLLAGAGMTGLAENLLALLVDAASGRQRTKNELAGVRQIAVFHDGVTL